MSAGSKPVLILFNETNMSDTLCSDWSTELSTTTPFLHVLILLLHTHTHTHTHQYFLLCYFHQTKSTFTPSHYLNAPVVLCFRSRTMEKLTHQTEFWHGKSLYCWGDQDHHVHWEREREKQLNMKRKRAFGWFTDFILLRVSVDSTSAHRQYQSSVSAGSRIKTDHS